MSADFITWWKKWRLGFALAGLMIAIELVALGLCVTLAPNGMRWLGGQTFNAPDYPIYLNYLAQNRTFPIVYNLYNEQQKIGRFEPFWSTAGLLVRTGLSPIMVHEILRWIATLILGLTIFSTAKSLVADEKRAWLASLIIASGMGSGWVHAIISNLFYGKILITIAPDLGTEFSLIPVIFGGAHMILSVSLQFLIARWTWLLLSEGQKKYFIPDLAAVFFLTSFHPYYIPLTGLIALICYFCGWSMSERLKRGAWLFALCAAMLPSLAYNYWLTQAEPALNRLYYQINSLRLDPFNLWIMALLFIFIASFFIIKDRVPQNYYWSKTPLWAVIWLASAVVCMILPFPWTTKFTQGLLPVLAILTLPFWLWLMTDLIPKGNIIPAISRFLIGLWLAGPLIYFLYFFALMPNAMTRNLFYQKTQIFAAWDFTSHDMSQNDLIVTTAMETNLWTPLYTLHKVWIGHAHATPDYYNRQTEWLTWFWSNDATEYNAFLDRNNIRYILTTDAEKTNKAARLLNNDWQKAFVSDDVAVWKKI